MIALRGSSSGLEVTVHCICCLLAEAEFIVAHTPLHVTVVRRPQTAADTSVPTPAFLIAWLCLLCAYIRERKSA